MKYLLSLCEKFDKLYVADTKSFFKILEIHMNDENYQRNENELLKKVNSMKADFKKVRGHNDGTGANPITCNFFEVFNFLFKKINNRFECVNTITFYYREWKKCGAEKPG